MNRVVDARALVAESRKRAPNGARADEVEAMLLDREANATRHGPRLRRRPS
jgi:hypothetical protein